MAEFWEEEARWQRERLAEPFPLTVSDPETVPGGLLTKSYTTYLVRAGDNPGVRRRFSDFDWLQDVLVARFHGFAIPLLPEKRMVGNTDENFIVERMAGLQQWMRQVAANPYLRLDTTFKVFLETPAGAEFDQAKRAALQGAGGNPAQNPGLARWFGCLRNYSLPEDGDAAVGELRALSDEVEAHAVRCLEAAQRMFDLARGMSEAVSALRRSFREWGQVAESRSAGLSDTNRVVRERTGELATFLGTAGETWGQVFELAKFAPNEINMFVMNSLVHEVQRVRSFKALLGLHRSAQEAYARAFQAQDRLEFQERQLKQKGREDQAAQMQPRIASARAETKAMKERLDDVTKGILHVESKNISIARIDKLRDALCMYATLNMDSGNKATNLWEGFITNVGVPHSEAVNAAHQVLTGETTVAAFDWALPSDPSADPRPAAAGAGEPVPGDAAAAGAGAGGDAGNAGEEEDAAAPSDDAAPVEGGADEGFPAADEGFPGADEGFPEPEGLDE